eukprot:757725-Amphidinium_carterae.3
MCTSYILEVGRLSCTQAWSAQEELTELLEHMGVAAFPRVIKELIFEVTNEQKSEVAPAEQR